MLSFGLHLSFISGPIGDHCNKLHKLAKSNQCYNVKGSSPDFPSSSKEAAAAQADIVLLSTHANTQQRCACQAGFAAPHLATCSEKVINCNTH
jgi:hypothetical protein